MKQITFNVPDSTIVIHCIVITNETDATNINAEFYDLRGGETEFTPMISNGTNQNKHTGGDEDGNA